jgi:hypothetical protein
MAHWAMVAICTATKVVVMNNFFIAVAKLSGKYQPECFVERLLTQAKFSSG